MANNRKQLECTVLTPKGEIYAGPAEFVAIPLPDGELGIAPGRRELVARLHAGELRMRTGGKTLRFYVEDGFAEVVEDRVRVLARTVIHPEELDGEALQAMLDELIARKCRSDEELADRDRAVSRLRQQLRLYRKEG